jgi:hypothetical protein
MKRNNTKEVEMKIKTENKIEAVTKKENDENDHEEHGGSFKYKVTNEVDNKQILDGLKSFLFTDWKKKDKKIKRIIVTGNFNASKDNPPWYIILPRQRAKIIWDIFASLAGVLNGLIVIVDMCWNFECFVDNYKSIRNMYAFFTTIFFLDILFNSLTAFLDKRNMYVYSLKLILINYIKKGMILDILTSLPYYWLLSFDYSNCFQPTIATTKFFYFFYLMRLGKLNIFFELIEKIFTKYTMAIRLIKLFTFIIFLANFGGNLFSAISPTVVNTTYSYCNGLYAPSSLENYQCTKTFTAEKFWNIYVYCLYLGILMTLGSDLQTQVLYEQVFLVCIVIISTIANASIYGNVAVMLSNVSFGVSPILRDKIDTMTEYMNFMKFDPIFKKQIDDYHLNIWYKQRNMMYDESFFGDMSQALHKILLLLQFQSSFFRFSKLFPIISESFILDLIVLLKPKIFMTNDIIITEGESTREVFLASSSSYCKVYIGGQWIKDLGNGDYFGEIAIFLRSRRRTATILCYKDSDFLHVEGEQMETLLRNYPEDYVRIKNKAVQLFINSMKFYPSNLFAKLVPNNNLKDYLFRKSIYLEDEEEDFILNKHIQNQIEVNDFNDKMNQIVDRLAEAKTKFLQTNIFE